MIGVLAKNDNLKPSANLAAGDTIVGSRRSGRTAAIGTSIRLPGSSCS
jgi:hypothetical protein